MNMIKRMFVLWLLVVGTSQANAGLEGLTLLDTVRNVSGKDSFTFQFSLENKAAYQLTVTDFAFPDALSKIGMTITNSTDVFLSEVMTSSSNTLDDSRIWGSGGHFSSGSGSLFDDHSWGSGKQQEQYLGLLNAGTYYLTMYAETPSDWYFSDGYKNGLYGVELIATPIPASIVFLSSGLAAFGFISRRKKAQIV